MEGLSKKRELMDTDNSVVIVGEEDGWRWKKVYRVYKW